MPIRSNKNLESYYDRFSTSGAGGPPFVPEPEWTGGRGIWFGGYGGPSPSGTNVIQYITIATTGNSTDFGDLNATQSHGTGSSNQSRGCCMGGQVGGTTRSNVVDYITFASTSNATDWGDLHESAWLGNYGVISNGTRGVLAGNYGPATNQIQYITIATTGSVGDIGDLTMNRTDTAGCSGANDRGIVCGNYPSSNVIEYFSIASANNAADFGDYSDSSWGGAGSDNKTRGWFCGNRPSNQNRMEYITTGTLGNSTDAGDLTQSFQYPGSFASDEGRGVIGANFDAPTKSINYWTIMSTSNAADFGDLLSDNVKYATAACSGT